jgi:hypothetical protein
MYLAIRIQPFYDILDRSQGLFFVRKSRLDVRIGASNSQQLVYLTEWQTMGLMSIDLINLQVLVNGGGSESEQVYGTNLLIAQIIIAAIDFCI